LISVAGKMEGMTKTEPRPIHLWLWEYTDRSTGQRKRTTWRMSEEAARTRWGSDATKAETSPEISPPARNIYSFIRR
jgi:hypothetical protein